MKEKFEFKIKFDVEREQFVLLCRLVKEYSDAVEKSEWLKCHNYKFSELYGFSVCVHPNKAPPYFSALEAELPEGVRLTAVILSGDNVHIHFEFSSQALLSASVMYAHWIKAIIDAGHFDELFARY